MTNTPTSHTNSSPELPRPKRRLGLIWAFLFLIVLAVAGWAVYKAGQPGQIIQTSTGGGGARGGSGGGGGGRRGGGTGPVPVAVTKVRRSNVPVYLQGIGNAAAYYTVTVKPRVDGQLMTLDVKEGDLVRAGQIIAQIDDRPFQIQKAQAQGVQARDAAQLANAKQDLERYKGLLAQNAIARQQLDTQTAVVAQLEGSLKQDDAAVANAELQITYSKVPAPITGRIGLRLVDPGNIVRATDAAGLVVITQIQPISILFTIPEDKLPQVTAKIRTGARLKVEAWNRDNTQRLDTGYLVTVDNQIDASTGTSRLKAVVDNSDNTLFPNQFVNVHLLVETQHDQLVVPNVAIQTGQAGRYVYVVDAESKVHNRPVTIGVAMADMSSLLSGVEEGDQVVVDGTDRLIEGATVRVRPAGGGRGGRGGSGRGGRGGRGGEGGGEGGGRGGEGRGGEGRGFGRGRGDGAGADAEGGAPMGEGRRGGRGGSGGRGGRGRRGGGGGAE